VLSCLGPRIGSLAYGWDGRVFLRRCPGAHLYRVPVVPYIDGLVGPGTRRSEVLRCRTVMRTESVVSGPVERVFGPAVGFVFPSRPSPVYGVQFYDFRGPWPAWGGEGL